MAFNIHQTPYGRVWRNEAHTQDEKEFRKIAILFPKDVTAMQSLIAAGLPKEIAESNVSAVEALKKAIASEIKEDGKVKGFAISKVFKDGDAYANTRIQNFEDDPENEGKPVPAYFHQTRGFYILNFKTKFAVEWYGPKKSDGMKDDTWAEGEVYNGCWARLLTKAYGYKVEGNQGYALGLGKFIQKWCDDEAYGGGSGESTASAVVEDAVDFTPKPSADDYIN
jgi:hypothetical protein